MKKNQNSFGNSSARSLHMKEKDTQKIWGTIFIFPALLFLAVIMLFPIFQIFYYSFTNWNGGLNSQFVWFSNYASIFSNPDFYTVLRNNFIILLLGVPLWTVFPLLVATLLYEGLKASKFFKTVYFFPSVLSMVIVGTLFKTLFGYIGPINEFLKIVGLEHLVTEWLGQGVTSLPVIVLAVNWSGFGNAMLIYLAAMSTIDTSIFEAGELDGVNFWQKTWYIMLPSIRHTVEFTIVLNIIYAFSQMFGYVLSITNGGPGYESTVLEFFIYTKGFGAGQMGYASALSVILFLLVCFVNWIQWLVTRQKGEHHEK